MDAADVAARVIEESLEQNLAAHKQRVAAQLGGDLDPDCQRCGVTIPPARREAVPGCLRCIDCQAAFEVQQKHHIN